MNFNHPCRVRWPRLVPGQGSIDACRPQPRARPTTQLNHCVSQPHTTTPTLPQAVRQQRSSSDDQTLTQRVASTLAHRQGRHGAAEDLIHRGEGRLQLDDVPDGPTVILDLLEYLPHRHRGVDLERENVQRRRVEKPGGRRGRGGGLDLPSTEPFLPCCTWHARVRLRGMNAHTNG